jgi:hypothetical protein
MPLYATFSEPHKTDAAFAVDLCLPVGCTLNFFAAALNVLTRAGHRITTCRQRSDSKQHDENKFVLHDFSFRSTVVWIVSNKK